MAILLGRPTKGLLQDIALTLEGRELKAGGPYKSHSMAKILAMAIVYSARKIFPIDPELQKFVDRNSDGSELTGILGQATLNHIVKSIKLSCDRRGMGISLKDLAEKMVALYAKDNFPEEFAKSGIKPENARFHGGYGRY